jgi:excisionase family DNA binding protein
LKIGYDLGALVETYLTVKEVALMVKLSVITIRRYTARKKIPFHKIFRAVRYKKSEIEQWVEKRGGSTADTACDLLESDKGGAV